MITGFHYRAALALTKITVKELSSIVGLHAVTLLRYKKVSNLELINCHSRNTQVIQDYFEKSNVLFPNKNAIKLKTNYRSKDITRFHLVAARIATRLNQNQLSFFLRISSGTLSILENLDNTAVINTRTLKNSRLISFFEHMGITFNDDYTVTLHKDPQKFIEKTKMLVDTKRNNI